MLVFCAGMPKAGSTLQYNLSKELLGPSLTTDYGWKTAGEFANGFTPTHGTSESHSIVKCHTVPQRLIDALSGTELRILSSRRDLRDVAASEREFELTQGKSIDEALALLDFHVEQLDRLARYDSCLIQDYDAMLDDLPSIVRQIAGHLGVEPTDDDVRDLAARWSVDAVRDRLEIGLGERRREQRRAAVRRVVRRVVGRPEPTEMGFDEDTLLWPEHVSSSRGRRGRYVGVLTPDEIALIEDRYGEWLRRYGYL